MKETNNFLTPKEVSKILGIHLRTVQRLTGKGKIKGIKIGKLWKYRRSDIERYISLGTDFSREPERKADSLIWPKKETSNFTNRRIFPRINSSIKCNYSINLYPFKNIHSEGIIKNISSGGIFLYGQSEKFDRVEVDDPIQLYFVLKKNMDINAKGKVIRKAIDGLGIKFKGIDKEIEGRIMEYAG